MAVDEALLRLTDEPTLRFYSWSPPGLSLGWFQRWSEFIDVEGDHVTVRRLTGGGAIYHQHELTFSLTGPVRLLPWAIPVQEVYVRLHHAIATGLESIGVRARAAGNRGRAAPRPEQLWCFSHPTHDDLMGPDGLKLLGSAQRRIQDPEPRLLHHGSLVVAPPDHPAGECASLRDQHVQPDLADLAALLAPRLARALDLPARAGTLTARERALAAAFEAERYTNRAFLQRR